MPFSSSPSQIQSTKDQGKNNSNGNKTSRYGQMGYYYCSVSYYPRIRHQQTVRHKQFHSVFFLSSIFLKKHENTHSLCINIIRCVHSHAEHTHTHTVFEVQAKQRAANTRLPLWPPLIPISFTSPESSAELHRLN